MKTIAEINGSKISMIENGDKLVPIKPICQALGIDDEAQRQKIVNDEILGSTALLSKAVGADGKEREMFCIPLMYAFGWLFTINPNNVSPDAKETVLRYKMECYKALYNHFTSQSMFLQQKQTEMIKQQDKLEQIREQFDEMKGKLKEETKRLKDISDYTFDKWQQNNRQLKLDFPID